MPAFTIVVVAAVVGLVLGSMLVLGAPYLALPIAAVAVAGIGWVEFRRRQRGTGDTAHMHEPAEERPAIEFDERDRATLMPSEEGDRAGGDS